MELFSFLEGRILFDYKGLLKKLMEIAQYKYKDYCIFDKKIEGIAH